MITERMYIVKACNHKVNCEASYYSFSSAIAVINHLHDYWPDLVCTLSLKNNVDRDLYKYDINYGG